MSTLEPDVERIDDLTDEQLRELIRRYGWSSVWGDDETGVPFLDEVLARSPWLAGMDALCQLIQSDEPFDPLRTTASPAQVAFQAAQQAWLDGPKSIADRYNDPANTVGMATIAGWALDAAGQGITHARKYLRSQMEQAAKVTEEAVVQLDAINEAEAARLTGVSRNTVRGWCGK